MADVVIYGPVTCRIPGRMGQRRGEKTGKKRRNDLTGAQQCAIMKNAA